MGEIVHEVGAQNFDASELLGHPVKVLGQNSVFRRIFQMQARGKVAGSQPLDGVDEFADGLDHSAAGKTGYRSPDNNAGYHNNDRQYDSALYDFII
ncbi:hypothetical protein D3C78_968050 [compost metagenome]